MKTTEWFDGSVRPVRTGVYQRQVDSGLLGYAKWDGRYWFYWHPTVKAAAKERFVSSIRNAPWRGVIKC